MSTAHRARTASRSTLALQMRWDGFTCIWPLSRTLQAKAARSWNVTADALRQAKAKAKKLGFPHDARIEYLCAKGVEAGPLLHNPNGAPPTRFDLITNPPDGSWKQRQDVLHGILHGPGGLGGRQVVRLLPRPPAREMEARADTT